MNTVLNGLNLVTGGLLVMFALLSLKGYVMLENPCFFVGAIQRIDHAVNVC